MLDFKEIEKLHSEYSKLDKSAKLGWFVQKKQLNKLTSQLSQYVFANGDFSNNEEREYVRQLLNMVNSVDNEGRKVVSDMANDAMKGLTKSLLTLD